MEHTINVQKALEQLGNSRKLYNSLITGFLHKYCHVDDMIHENIYERYFDEAGRLAHTMKGLSGNIGAEILREYAIHMEKRINTFDEGTSIKEIEQFFMKEWGDFSKELYRVVTALDKILLEDVEDERIEPGLREKLMRADKLIRILETYNYQQIKMHFNSECQEGYSECWDELLVLIQEFEYDEAAELLRKTYYVNQ